MKLSRSVVLLLLTLSFKATAQEIRIGGLEGNGAVFAGLATTFIDWSRPAAGTGVVNTASVAWSEATTPCDDIFSVRFYAIPSNALATVMIAERGPFRAVNGINTVTLDPPVAVTSETYIGLHRADGAASCGQPYGTFSRTPGRALISNSDFTGGLLTGLSPVGNFRLLAQASSSPSVRVSTIPAVASSGGAAGSFFRTSLTLSNPSSLPIQGKLVMRLAGRSGTDADPSLEFTVPENGTINYPDVVTAMGQSGLGSIDILTTASPTPIATARVFNDAGDKGTSGLFEEAVPAGKPYFNVGTILIPDDLVNYRLNIGIRTISEVALNVSIYNSAGQLQTLFVKNYPANFMEQVTASQFTENRPLPPGGKIVITAYEKEFMVYGAVTDNRTNDPSMRIGLD